MGNAHHSPVSPRFAPASIWPLLVSAYKVERSFHPAISSALATWKSYTLLVGNSGYKIRKVPLRGTEAADSLTPLKKYWYHWNIVAWPKTFSLQPLFVKPCPHLNEAANGAGRTERMPRSCTIKSRFFVHCSIKWGSIKLGLHLNVNANEACGSDATQNVRYICTLFGICCDSE